MLSTISYNCHNIKASFLVLQKLIQNNDILFVVEHWLAEEEEFIINEICGNVHQKIFQSDYSLSNKKRSSIWWQNVANT